jgi:hypothetical protein
VSVAKPMNLSAPMIHAFLDNIRYITIELNGLILYGARDDVPREMDKSRGGHHQLRVVRPLVEEVPQPVSVRHRNE